MEGWTSIVALAVAVVGVWICVFPPRAPHRAKTRKEIRAEWQRERRFWAGAPDMREGRE